MKKIIRRGLPDKAKESHLESYHPLLQRIYQHRGISSSDDVDYSLSKLLSYTNLKGITDIVACLEYALVNQKHIMVVGDFDVDGATSTVLAIKVLRKFGLKNISYLIPNRFEFGYGLSPEIVAVAAKKKPDLIITVDNGIASLEGVLAAKNFGIKVLLTDHHLPGRELPAADAIVNPNQIGDEFLSKNLAGVGVIFYVMLALRAHLKEISWFEKNNIEMPNMRQFLDLVALGTVADVVPLDKNNRILVAEGLQVIRSGNCSLGIKALLSLSNRDYSKINANDLAFAVAPRLNAAGRLEDMSVGIECLLNENIAQVRGMASELDALNKERREIEADMQREAFGILNNLKLAEQNLPLGICLYEKSWHQGVVGILASRIKDKMHRPTIAFAMANEEEVKGSGRSIAGLHLRNVLENLAIKNPGLITKFGGHAMAAGVTLQKSNYELFNKLFVEEVSQHISEDDLEGVIHTDGDLSLEYFTLDIVELLQKGGPWGQNFPEPVFDNVFEVVGQRLVGQKHLKLNLRLPGSNQEFEGICFNIDPKIWPNYRCLQAHIAYKLAVNEYNGRRSLQLLIEEIL